MEQVFSFEFCEIFKNTLFTEHLWMTVFILSIVNCHFCLKNQPLDSFESVHVLIILHTFSLMNFVQTISGIIPTSLYFLGSPENKPESLRQK